MTALMTAESIIAVFLLAYSPAISEMLLRWSQDNEPLSALTTTVGSGLVIYALVLTAFRSIHLLYKSIDTANLDDRDYEAGYDLFLMVIAGSFLFVLENAISILQFPLTRRPLTIPYDLGIPITLFIFIAWVLIILIDPVQATKRVRKLVRRERKKRQTT